MLPHFSFFLLFFCPLPPPTFIFAPLHHQILFSPSCFAKINFWLAYSPNLISAWFFHQTSFSPGRDTKFFFHPVAAQKFLFAQALRQNWFSPGRFTRISFRPVAPPKIFFARKNFLLPGCSSYATPKFICCHVLCVFKIHFHRFLCKISFSPSFSAQILFHLAAPPKFLFSRPLCENSSSPRPLRRNSFSLGPSAKIPFRSVAPPKFISAQPLRPNSCSIACLPKIHLRPAALPKFIFPWFLRQNFCLNGCFYNIHFCRALPPPQPTQPARGQPAPSAHVACPTRMPHPPPAARSTRPLQPAPHASLQVAPPACPQPALPKFIFARLLCHNSFLPACSAKVPFRLVPPPQLIFAPLLQRCSLPRCSANFHLYPAAASKFIFAWVLHQHSFAPSCSPTLIFPRFLHHDSFSSGCSTKVPFLLGAPPQFIFA